MAATDISLSSRTPAYKHDIAFSGDYQGAADADLCTVETFGEALAGSDRPFVIASGTAGLTPGVVGTEEDAGDPDSAAAARLPSEQTALSLASRGVRSSAVRLPPSVHGEGEHGFVATLIGIARGKGVSGYIGDGTNRWPAVHRLDAAHLFRLALETAPAGSVLHGVADKGVPVHDIAEVIGRHLNLPVVSIPREEAGDHFGWRESPGRCWTRPRARSELRSSGDRRARSIASTRIGKAAAVHTPVVPNCSREAGSSAAADARYSTITSTASRSRDHRRPSSEPTMSAKWDLPRADPLATAPAT
jgi:hypothetical protein